MEKINLNGVPETMLQTLYARAKETEKNNHCIFDPKAVEIVSQLDYDFSNASRDKAMSQGVIARTIVLDKLVEDNLKCNPQTIVVNIACGLDTRCYRMAGKYKRWYNLDLPETIDVRKMFLPEESGNISQLAFSATDPKWADKIEYSNEPVLIIIEGLTMYLSEADVIEIFNIISSKFSNVDVFMETMNPWVVKHVKEKSIEGSQAKFSWGIKNGKEIQKIIPDFKSVKDVSLTEGMKVFMPIYKFLGKIPFVRNISNKIAVLQKV